jgi:biopolymer transport protein ExbB
MIILAEGIGLFSMIFKGGWLMLPIFALSIWAVYVFFDKYFKLKKLANQNISVERVLAEIEVKIEAGEELDRGGLARSVDPQK